MQAAGSRARGSPDMHPRHSPRPLRRALQVLRSATNTVSLELALFIILCVILFAIFIVGFYIYEWNYEAKVLREKCHSLLQSFPHDTPFPDFKEPVLYHSYWRGDLRPFGRKQAAVVKSYLATQNLNKTRFILWCTDDISNNRYLRGLLEGGHVEVRVWEVGKEAAGTPIEGHSAVAVRDTMAWLDGDLFRLIVLYKYGGLYLDMDTLLVNDLAPVIRPEFMFEWDCNYRRTTFQSNGALMRFYRKSVVITQLLNQIKEVPPNHKTTQWGTWLYQTVYNRLLAQNADDDQLAYDYSPPTHNINNNDMSMNDQDDDEDGDGGRWSRVGAGRAWTVWPWCFFDPLQCYDDPQMEIFQDVPFPKNVVNSLFAIHWHNRWEDPIHPNSIFAYLEKQHEERIRQRLGLQL